MHLMYTSERKFFFDDYHLHATCANRIPMKYLDSMRDAHLNNIEFHLQKVERLIIYILQLTVSPVHGSQALPQADDWDLLKRIEKLMKQAHEMYRNGLLLISNICDDVQRVYVHAEDEIKMMLINRKVPPTPKLQAVQSSNSNSLRPESRAAKSSRKVNRRPRTSSGHKKNSKDDDNDNDNEEEKEGSETHKNIAAEFFNFNKGDDGNETGDFEEVNLKVISSPQRLNAGDYDEDGFEKDDDFEFKAAQEDQSNKQEVATVNNDSKSELKESSSHSKRHVTLIEQSENQQSMHLNEGSTISRSSSRNRIRQDDIALARSDTNKSSNKRLLEDLLSQGSPKSRNSSPKEKPKPAHASFRMVNEDKDIPWNPVRCSCCNNRFRGDGKQLPSLVGDDTEIKKKASDAAARIDAIITNFNRRVVLGDDYQERQKELVGRLKRTSSATRRVNMSGNSVMHGTTFCSWECLKRWTHAFCSLQFKYQYDKLIDIAAGYFVDV